uniref:Fibronectin type-III domain-containing protein n=1 Tax=Macrostomum lignano TaxID=282301 RepID=A0A1I8HNN6_9PLAT
SIAELFGIDASSAQYSSNETAISVTWQPSSTSGVSYQLTCKRVGSGEVWNASSSTPSGTCGSLQSGQAYELRVAVQKAGFDDVITRLSNQLTKLFGIDASSAQHSSNETAISVTWQPSSTSGVSYQLTCKRVGSGEVSTASSATPSATCGSLQSGQEYEL